MPGVPARLDPEVVMAYKVGDNTEDVIISIGDGKVTRLFRLTEGAAEDLVCQLYLNDIRLGLPGR